MSVIGAANLTVLSSTFASTGRDGAGTAPMAGLDFEPNSPAAVLTGIRLRNCTFVDNFGAGISFVFGKLGTGGPPLDIVVDNCTIDGNASAAAQGPRTMCAGLSHRGRVEGCTNQTCAGAQCFSYASPGIELTDINPGQAGSIVVSNTRTRDTLDHGLWIRDWEGPIWEAPACPVRFSNCSFDHTALRPGPLHFPAWASSRADNSEGPGGPTGPLRTPFQTPGTLSGLTKTH
jgi:hypothetical protein